MHLAATGDPKSSSTASTNVLSAICLIWALCWVMPSARCQSVSANTSTDNRHRDKIARGYIADADETVPSKEELLRQKLNPEGNPAKENLLGRMLTMETEELKALLEPLVEEEWQFLQPMSFTERGPVPVVQPLKRRTPEEFLQYVHDRYATKCWFALPRDVAKYVCQHKPAVSEKTSPLSSASSRPPEQSNQVV